MTAPSNFNFNSLETESDFLRFTFVAWIDLICCTATSGHFLHVRSKEYPINRFFYNFLITRSKFLIYCSILTFKHCNFLSSLFFNYCCSFSVINLMKYCSWV